MGDTWIKPARLEKYFLDTKRTCTPQQKCHASINECAAHRRQAFIDRRKTKLAAQSLHVQKVLLRANSRQNLVEKLKSLTYNLQQADAARRHLLMLTSTSCALRVAHSKSVARDMQSLRSTNAGVLRLQVEDRHRQAEERRQAFLKVRREKTPLHGNGENLETLFKSRSSPKAAIAIQRYWRTAVLQRTFKGFLSHNSYGVGKVPFSTAAEMLNAASTINAATKVLQILNIIHTPETSRSSNRISVRIFLAAFMIVYRPTEVLSGSQSNNLVNAAARLLKRLMFLMTTFLSDKPIPITIEWQSYQQIFQMWKNHDRDELAFSMAQKYAELELLGEKVLATEDVLYAEPYRVGISSNQNLIMAKLRRLIGSAAQPLVHDALSRVRSAEKLKAEEFFISREGDKSGLLAARPSNRQIVLEILLDRAYRLQPPRDSVSSRASRLKEMIVDSIEGKSNSFCKNVPSLARHFKMRLLLLCANASSLRSKVDEAIDLTLIEQQSSRGTSSYEDLLGFTISMMRELASPFRDSFLQILANEKDPKKQLMGVLDGLDTLSIDLVNFHLTLASPMILENGVDYERNCFREDLEQGLIKLTFTKSWLGRYANRHGNRMGSKYKAWIQAFVDLLLSNSSLPETMEIGRNHMLEIRSDLHMIIIIATLTLMAKSKLANFNISWTRLWRSLWDRRSSNMSASTLSDNFVSEIHSQGVQINEENVTMLHSIAMKASETELDPTCHLLRKRVESCLQRHLDGSGSALCSIGVSESNFSFRQIVGRVARVGQVNREIYSPWYDSLMDC